jgi:hypothetical protein
MHNQLATLLVFFCASSLKVEENTCEVVHIVSIKYSNLTLGRVRWTVDILPQRKTYDKHSHHSSGVSTLKLYEYVCVCYTKLLHTLENPKR